ncbi:MAG: hypothetical protein HKP62_04530 [Sulfurovum sp.]|nr:hypothetical protein [Sulfurovum sp.]NNJ45264.1 hypothetical protein [Sulfurovum sp.]
MSKKVQLYIRNTGTGPFKIPFKKETPKEIQKKVNGTIKVGAKRVIPSTIAEYVDIGILEHADKVSRIKLRMKEVKEIPSITKIKKSKKILKKVENKIDKDEKDSKKKGGK